MAEPLTFLFRFQDDGSSPSGSATAPVGARPGGALAASPPPDNQSQTPRRGRATAAAGQSGNGGRSTPRGSNQRRPRRDTDAGPTAAGQRGGQRHAPSAASQVFDDLIRAVRRIPGPIGKTVGLINDLAEPFQRARRRYRELLEAHAARQPQRERGQAQPGNAAATTLPRRPRPRRRSAAQPRQRAPRRPGRASQAARRPARRRHRPATGGAARANQPRQPAAAQPGGQPQRGLISPPRSPIPTSLSPERQALQRLIDALGPLPANQRDLINAIRSLRDLGYSHGELQQGLHDRRERLQRDAQHAARQQPNAAQRQRQRTRRQHAGQQTTRAPQRPGRATQVARSTGQAAQQGGAAGDAAGQVAGRGAAAGAMEGMGGALAGGLLIGLGAVAAVGAATVAFDALVSTVKKLDSLFVGLGQKLAPFNGRLAAANAINNAKNTISDITSAQTIGDKLARYTDARGDLLRKLQRILDILEGWALDALTPLVEHGADILKEMLEGILIIKEFVANFQFSLNPATLAKNFQDAALKAALKVDELMRRQQNAKNLVSLQGMFGGGLTDLIVEGLNFGSGQKPAQPPGMRVGPIPPAGIGGI